MRRLLVAGLLICLVPGVIAARFKAAQDWLDLVQYPAPSRADVQSSEDGKEFLSQLSGVSRSDLSHAKLAMLFGDLLPWERT